MAEQRHVAIRDLQVGGDLPLTLIAGPCQLESRAHALEMAGALKEISENLGKNIGKSQRSQKISKDLKRSQKISKDLNMSTNVSKCLQISEQLNYLNESSPTRSLLDTV